MKDLNVILMKPKGKTIEHKRDLSSLKPILKNLVAFANTAGGTMIIGKEDSGAVVGIDDVFSAEEKLASSIADSIYPPLMPEIEIVTVQNKTLLVIRVPHWRGPFYIKTEGPEKGVYIRLGSTNRIASADIIAEIMRSKANTSFDQLPIPELDVSAINMEKIEKVFSKVGKIADINNLISMGILVPYSNKQVCSNGGLILFGKDEFREKYFPNSVVRCARFRGDDRVEFIDQLDVEGSIIDAVDQVPKFIRRNSRLAAKIESTYRKDIPEYSPVAIREVLTNALVHADYSIKGMNPRIAIYSNRLEIESPGMFPFGYTMENFISGVSHVRNKVISRVFRELKLMEGWGTGYKRIKNVCEKQGYQTPVWQENGTSIRVSFEPHLITKGGNHPTTDKPSPTLTTRQEQILQLFETNSLLNSTEVLDKLSLNVAERTIRKDLLTLKELGLITKIGDGPITKWKLV